MTLDNRAAIKVIFGLIIFMFSLALVYFTANYVEHNKIFDFWSTLAICAGIYIIIGIAVYQIFSISLGFLFAADVLIIHLLLENFGDIPDILKTTIIAVILIVLYSFAWPKMKDQTPSTLPTTPTPKS